MFWILNYHPEHQVLNYEINFSNLKQNKIAFFKFPNKKF